MAEEKEPGTWRAFQGQAAMFLKLWEERQGL